MWVNSLRTWVYGKLFYDSKFRGINRKYSASQSLLLKEFLFNRSKENRPEESGLNPATTKLVSQGIYVPWAHICPLSAACLYPSQCFPFIQLGVCLCFPIWKSSKTRASNLLF